MCTLNAALFDFDGVVVDTEPVYDRFWEDAIMRHKFQIPDFLNKIRGITMSHLMDTYFSDYPEAFRQQILEESIAYERQMPLPLLPGSLDFVRYLHENGIRTALVTSSDQEKIDRAFNMYASYNIRNLFDSVVTADRITRGKPDPMCYQLAASELQVSSSECLVFEDSFAGIEAAQQAGMSVVGLSTSNSASSLLKKVRWVISDFLHIQEKSSSLEFLKLLGLSDTSR